MMAVRVRITSTSLMFLLLCSALLATTLQGVQGEVEVEGPSESECRPYIEKALKKLETGDTQSADIQNDDITHIVTTDDSDNKSGDEIETIESKSVEDGTQEIDDEQELSNTNTEETKSVEDDNETVEDEKETDETGDTQEVSIEEINKSKQDDTASNEKKSETIESAEKYASVESEHEASSEKDNETEEQRGSTEDQNINSKQEVSVEQEAGSHEQDEIAASVEQDSAASAEQDTAASVEQDTVTANSAEQDTAGSVEEENTGRSVEQEDGASVETNVSSEQDEVIVEQEVASLEHEARDSKEKQQTSIEKDEVDIEQGDVASAEVTQEASIEKEEESEKNEVSVEKDNVVSTESTENESADEKDKNESSEKGEKSDEKTEENRSIEGDKGDGKAESEQESVEKEQSNEDVASKERQEGSEENKTEPTPEEDLTWEIEIPTDLRPRDHLNEILNLNDEPTEQENVFLKAADKTLNELKRIYENAIKPLEVVYKYRDLSNRHFGDPEIFSKPLVLFMGPWSGGKSSIINYLLDNEYAQTTLRTGAEPSPAYFNLLMWGEEPEVLDGTQLAADWTFSGLQKFGQGLEERLRGLKLPNKLLEKINIVEIPGILEVRKQVSRIFPFNDACQWFIDRADIIFLVYDPSKLDVGPETEAILDQLKGREYQTRIILNKADQVKPEELMRVQGALIWNISPLMSSAQPPVMYSTSLWSKPYEVGAPVRLLHAQERAFLKDLKTAVDKRIENKIASARRFAVRVRNHAKMVDCYLTTYYNHKSVFGNKKLVADQIIEHPQDYHIYEGLSTLTNISRYDLPDPDVYRDFFRLNPLYDFQQLSATCTYFRGCPINRLDIAIAYDLPELVGKYKKMIEPAMNNSADSTPKS